jgi:hypothetical protein
MKERPILFSDPMVRALLEGSKTQTRRVVKPKHLPFVENLTANFLDGKWGERPMPYGGPGDRLWVREKWQAWDCTSVMDKEWEPWDRERRSGLSINEYHAEHGNPDGIEYAATSESLGPWTPSIHMPRWASRITLEITGVRVERLQDISEADSVAEGCTKNHNGYFWGGPHDVSGLKQMATAQKAYRDLWESINGPGSWEANPWVWVVSFKHLEGSTP